MKLSVLQLEFRRLADLTAKVVRESTYAIAQGGFSDVWKCRCRGQDDSFEVCLIVYIGFL
jgi:hypothetical protein